MGMTTFYENIKDGFGKLDSTDLTNSRDQGNRLMVFLVTGKHGLKMSERGMSQCREITMNDEKCTENEKKENVDSVYDLNAAQQINVIRVTFHFPKKDTWYHLCRQKK